MQKKKRMNKKELTKLPADYREAILLGRKELRSRKRKQFWEEHFWCFFDN